MILCKLAGHREILILFMANANANANLYQFFKLYLYLSLDFSHFYTRVSIFKSGSSVKMMFTSCICLFLTLEIVNMKFTFSFCCIKSDLESPRCAMSNGLL